MDILNSKPLENMAPLTYLKVLNTKKKMILTPKLVAAKRSEAESCTLVETVV